MNEGQKRKRAWAAVEAALLKHHHEPDTQAAKVLYASLAAHALPDPPVWPMLVAPPGSMKTELIDALDGLPNVHLIDRVTPNTFLSGQIKEGKRPATATSSSLLHRIGPSGIVLYPDFSTILSMNRAHRGAVLADMRRIYDGHLRKEYGTDENQSTHEWRGRITFAVATTDEVDRHYAVFQTLGERFVMARWSRPGGVDAAMRAMNQNKEESKRELKEAVHGLVKSLGNSPPTLSMELRYRIAALAEFAVRARTHIHRDGYDKKIDYIPEPEAATRLAQQLAQLSKGSALVNTSTTVEAEDFRLVQRVAFDCIPTARRKLLQMLIQGEGASDAELPASTRSYVTEDLRALGLMTGDRLSELAKSLLDSANK